MVAMNAIPRYLPVFDGKGYEDWCMKVDVILGFQECFSRTEGDASREQATRLQGSSSFASMCFCKHVLENFPGCNLEASMGYFATSIWQYWENKEGQATISQKTI